jgi:hypothetical protein
MFQGWVDGTPWWAVWRMYGLDEDGTGAGGESTSESQEWNPIYVDAYRCVDILY